MRWSVLLALVLLAGCDWERDDRFPGGGPAFLGRAPRAAAEPGPRSESAVSYRLGQARRASGPRDPLCDGGARLFDNARDARCASAVFAGFAGAGAPPLAPYDAAYRPASLFRPIPSPEAEDRLAAALSGNGFGPAAVSAVLRESRLQAIDPFLVAAVASQESAGLACVRSPAGARGVMQLMPDTARFLGVSDPCDPHQNVRGGVSYLKMMFDEFADLDHALMAYNGGPALVQAALAGRVRRLPQETVDYPAAVMRHYADLRAAAGD